MIESEDVELHLPDEAEARGTVWLSQSHPPKGDPASRASSSGCRLPFGLQMPVASGQRTARKQSTNTSTKAESKAADDLDACPAPSPGAQKPSHHKIL